MLDGTTGVESGTETTTAALGVGGSPNLHRAPANEEYSRLRLALLDRKREVLLRLRHEGTIDDSVARQIQTRLDIEELRLTGVEPLG